jgi:hypothetical protein
MENNNLNKIRKIFIPELNIEISITEQLSLNGEVVTKIGYTDKNGILYSANFSNSLQMEHFGKLNLSSLSDREKIFCTIVCTAIIEEYFMKKSKERKAQINGN